MESSQFKQILLPLSNKMYRVAFSIVNDSDIAKDIVQDVCISLWNMRDKLSQIQNIDTFVM
jgi:RNA polymerase sigma-70 factor (ECF subfamily)